MENSYKSKRRSFSNKICSVPMCSNRTSKTISLHKFPRDKRYRDLWARLFRTRIVTKNDYACNAHFEPNCFFATKKAVRRKLKKDAIPSLNLPDKNYWKTASARKKEARKIRRIKFWRAKNNLKIDDLPPEPDTDEDGNEGLPLPITDGDFAVEEPAEDEGLPLPIEEIQTPENDLQSFSEDMDSSSDDRTKVKRNSRSYCSVPQCGTYGSSNIPMHFFPKDKKEAKKWQKVLKIRKPLSAYMLVCGQHFKPTDYLPKRADQKCGRLKRGAVPNLNLPSMSREAAKSIQRRLREVAEEYAHMMFLNCPKDPVIRNECLLKLQSKIPGLSYTSKIRKLRQVDEKTVSAVEAKLAELKAKNECRIQIKQEMKSDDEINSNDTNDSNHYGITYEEIQMQELMEDLKNEPEDSDMEGYSPLNIPDEYQEDTMPNETKIIKRRITDQELVRLFLTNASLIKRFLKDKTLLQKYLDVAEEVQKSVNKDKKDDCSVFGDFVAKKLKELPTPDLRKELQTWIQRGIECIANI
ncbi:uncharacterized protein LOC106668108 [Cimex lectularius]|uniref:THAP-type domain-containing protein n=1 Tax=Cimex lectularius TaxID=79782 RepID=A0A8I6RV94_CIMLE|nr:uncharacterized protein LOC106668108 [Cimex lectularius]